MSSILILLFVSRIFFSNKVFGKLDQVGCLYPTQQLLTPLHKRQAPESAQKSTHHLSENENPIHATAVKLYAVSTNSIHNRSMWWLDLHGHELH